MINSPSNWLEITYLPPLSFNLAQSLGISCLMFVQNYQTYCSLYYLVGIIVWFSVFGFFGQKKVQALTKKFKSAKAPTLWPKLDVDSISLRISLFAFWGFVFLHLFSANRLKFSLLPNKPLCQQHAKATLCLPGFLNFPWWYLFVTINIIDENLKHDLEFFIKANFVEFVLINYGVLCCDSVLVGFAQL